MASVVEVRNEERGSAAVEAAFAIFFLILIALGVVQLVLSLYARNVVVSSAHEGARAAIELGRSVADAEAVARRSVTRAAGGLVRGLRVEVTADVSAHGMTARVRVRGLLPVVGPIPLPLPVDATATASRSLP